MPGEGRQRATEQEAKLHLLAGKLEAGAIERIEVLHIPLDTLTRIPISPVMLENSYSVKLTLKVPEGMKSPSDLESKLENAEAKRTSEVFDFRTAIVFYGNSGARDTAIFFDKTGIHASVDDVPVILDPGLYRWLTSNYADCLD